VRLLTISLLLLCGIAVAATSITGYYLALYNSSYYLYGFPLAWRIPGSSDGSYPDTIFWANFFFDVLFYMSVGNIIAALSFTKVRTWEKKHLRLTLLATVSPILFLLLYFLWIIALFQSLGTRPS
jgi:hypothetical protein